MLQKLLGWLATTKLGQWIIAKLFSGMQRS
jgi:hypothetical protein